MSAAEKSPGARIGLDDRVDIDSLLGRDELAELTARFAEAHGCAVAVEDLRGGQLASKGKVDEVSSRNKIYDESLVINQIAFE